MNAYNSSAWLETFAVVATGVAIIWLLANLACRFIGSARGQRAIWQTAVLSAASGCAASQRAATLVPSPQSNSITCRATAVPPSSGLAAVRG